MITPAYTKHSVLARLRAGFAANHPQGIQLEQFLDGDSYRRLLRAVRQSQLKKKEVRDTHSFYSATSPALQFFNSRAFLSFASVVTGHCLTKAMAEIRMFMHGSYTLLHDETETDGVEFILDLTPSWKMEWGGFSVLRSADGSTLAIPPTANTLVLVSGKSYVKYVNHNAKQNGRLVIRGVLR